MLCILDDPGPAVPIAPVNHHLPPPTEVLPVVGAVHHRATLMRLVGLSVKLLPRSTVRPQPPSHSLHSVHLTHLTHLTRLIRLVYLIHVTRDIHAGRPGALSHVNRLLHASHVRRAGQEVVSPVGRRPPRFHPTPTHPTLELHPRRHCLLRRKIIAVQHVLPFVCKRLLQRIFRKVAHIPATKVDGIDCFDLLSIPSTGNLHNMRTAGASLLVLARRRHVQLATRVQRGVNLLMKRVRLRVRESAFVSRRCLQYQAQGPSDPRRHGPAEVVTTLPAICLGIEHPSHEHVPPPPIPRHLYVHINLNGILHVQRIVLRRDGIRFQQCIHVI
mmetsp:Transcript_14417/g.41173  ORF Transcript_14417/g.41173 Transcript_14417/m.41173 type:complete len:329 (-) Transcript_14417:200-1186(-)